MSCSVGKDTAKLQQIRDFELFQSDCRKDIKPKIE